MTTTATMRGRGPVVTAYTLGAARARSANRAEVLRLVGGVARGQRAERAAGDAGDVLGAVGVGVVGAAPWSVAPSAASAVASSSVESVVSGDPVSAGAASAVSTGFSGARPSAFAMAAATLAWTRSMSGSAVLIMGGTSDSVAIFWLLALSARSAKRSTSPRGTSVETIAELALAIFWKLRHAPSAG